MTLGGRKRYLNMAIDTVIGDAYPSEAMSIGQWLLEMGHMIIITETETQIEQTPPPPPEIEQSDLSLFDTNPIPPDQLN